MEGAESSSFKQRESFAHGLQQGVAAPDNLMAWRRLFATLDVAAQASHQAQGIVEPAWDKGWRL